MSITQKDYMEKFAVTPFIGETKITRNKSNSIEFNNMYPMISSRPYIESALFLLSYYYRFGVKQVVLSNLMGVTQSAISHRLNVYSYKLLHLITVNNRESYESLFNKLSRYIPDNLEYTLDFYLTNSMYTVSLLENSCPASASIFIRNNSKHYKVFLNRFLGEHKARIYSFNTCLSRKGRGLCAFDRSFIKEL